MPDRGNLQALADHFGAEGQGAVLAVLPDRFGNMHTVSPFVCHSLSMPPRHSVDPYASSSRRNGAHPGGFVKTKIIEANGLSQTGPSTYASDPTFHAKSLLAISSVAASSTPLGERNHRKHHDEHDGRYGAPFSIASRTELIAELDRIRKAGYCVARSQQFEGDLSVGAPIWDASGTVIACVTIGSLEFGGPNRERERELIDAVVSAARSTSRAMGAQTD